MKKALVLAGFLLLLSPASLAETPEPPCVSDPAKMPESWRPPPGLQKSLSPAPWSDAETKDAQYAIETGVDEMIAYIKRNPSALDSLWGDSIEALIQVTYASANTPEFDAKVQNAARENLSKLIGLVFKRKPGLEDATCEDYAKLLPLAIAAHTLYRANDPRTARITKRTNIAYRDCGSLQDATGLDHNKILATEQASPDILLEVYIWALWFMEASIYPDIELPAEARTYTERLWRYLKAYRLAGADAFARGPWDDEFVLMADLAPHIAHIPTATHRFPLYVEDFPDLYRYHRENFYAVMELGELDLFASFVDTLRQYGCTPENDIQVRDGSRFLLKIFHDNDDRWMNYRQEGETDAELDDYDIIHYPWTAILGLRDRKPEEPRPGTIGGAIRRWLSHPR